MKKLNISFFIFIPLIFISGCRIINTNDNMSFKTPFIKSENKQKDVNSYEPDFYYKPWIYIKIINPVNGKSEIVSATIDTGSDNCYISRKLANHLGFKDSDESPLTTYTADGSMETHAIEGEYLIADEKKEIVKDFPIQKTHFYINESNSYHIVLGIRGFIDRFKEIKMIYPDNIELFW